MGVTTSGVPSMHLVRMADGWREMAFTRFGDGFIAASRDVTSRVRAEEALRESQARWQFALEGSGDGVWDWRVGTDERIYSPRWKAFSPDETSTAAIS